MKNKIILTILMLTLNASAQMQFIDITTPTTNTTASSAFISIPGFFNSTQYWVTNPTSITIGDPLATAFGKINSDFAYCTNQFVFLLQLPNQINTNWQTYSVGLSNYMTTLANNFGATNSLIVTQRGGLTVTNFGTKYGTWVFSLILTDSITSTPAFIVQRPSLGTNFYSMSGLLASVTTNTWALPVNPGTTNSIVDVSGTGASIGVVDSHIEQ